MNAQGQPRWQRARVRWPDFPTMMVWCRAESPKPMPLGFYGQFDGLPADDVPSYEFNVWSSDNKLSRVRADAVELLSEFADDVPVLTIEEWRASVARKATLC